MADLPHVYTEEVAEKELENVIAQATCGLHGAFPEQADKELAKIFLDLINSDNRFEAGFMDQLRLLV